MEDLFALADFNTLGQSLLAYNQVVSLNLLFIKGNTALLNKAASLTLAGCQTAHHKQVNDANAVVGNVIGIKLGGGHITVVTAACKEGFSASSSPCTRAVSS